MWWGGVGGPSPQALSGPSSSPGGRESLGALQGQAFSALLSTHIPFVSVTVKWGSKGTDPFCIVQHLPRWETGVRIMDF